MRPYPASLLGSRFSALASNNHGARALGTVCQLTNSTAIGQADPRYYWYLHLPHGRGCPHVRATSSQRTECVSLSVRLSLSPRALRFRLLTLVGAQSPMGTRVLPGWIVRSSRPPSPPGGLLRVGPGRARPTVVRESSKVNWLNVCRPSDGHPRHPTWTTPPAGSPVLHMLVEQ